MKNHDSLRDDIIVVLTAVILTGILSFLLHREFRYTETNPSEPAGYAGSRINKAVRRSASRSVWHALTENHGIWSGDWIATGPQSGITIRLNNGASVTLDQNTMLVITLKKGLLETEILEGSADITAPAAGEIRVRYGEKTFTLKDGSARFSKKGKELLLDEVLSLTAVINSTAVTVSAPVALKHPLPQQIIYADDSAIADVGFQWADTKTGAYYFELSDVPGFTEILHAERINGNEYNLKLAPGIYYWRVRRAEDPAGPSARFFIREKQYVKLITPKENADLITGDNTHADVFFSWSLPGDSAPVLLEIASTEDFSSPLISTVTERDSASAKLPPGKYYWRVIQRDRHSAGQARPSVGSFTVARKTFSAIFSNPYSKTRTIPADQKRNPAAQTQEESVTDSLPASLITGLASAPAFIGEPRGLIPANHSVIDMSHADEIEFRWNLPASSGIPDFRIKYRFRLYHKEKQIYETVLNDTHFSFRKLELLDTGNFSWTLQAFSESPDVQSGTVKNYFEIILSEKPEMPSGLKSE